MPVIREYRRQVGSPGAGPSVRASAEDFGAAQGRATESLGNAVQNTANYVAKRIDQENTSEVTTQMAQASAELSAELQEINRTAVPGDKKVFDDYNKKVKDTISKIGENASTQTARQFYNENSIRLQAQFERSSAQSQADLAGVKAVNDYTSTLNSLSAAAASDPSAISLQRDLHKAAIENLVNTGQLPRSKAMELETQGDKAIIVSSVRGWAQLDPNYAKEKLASGEYDSQLGADGKRQLLGEIDQAVRAREVEQERLVREQERVQKIQRQQTQNDFLQAMVEGKLTTKDVLNSNLEAFGSGSKEQFIEMIKKANSPAERLKTDGATMVALFNRIHLPDGDPEKIVDENELNKYFGNGLSMADLNKLRDEMQGKQTEAGSIEADLKKNVIEIAKGQLTKSNPITGFKDPIGDEQMQRFMSFFLEEYKAQKQKGKTAYELLNPDSPDYLGRAISQFTRSPQQIMRDLVPKKKQEAQGLALTPSMPAASASNKIKVSNGKETYLIDPKDLSDAQRDGFREVK